MNVLLTFINGQFDAASSNMTLLPDTVQCTVQPQGVHLDIARAVNVDVPLHFLFITKENATTHPCNKIMVGENSQVTIIEEHVSDGASNYLTESVVEIYAKKYACVNYYKLQNEDLTATHTAETYVEQEQESCVKTFFVSQGAKCARENLRINQCAAGAKSYLYGLYHLTCDQQTLEQHVHVDHKATQGMSAMLYKGVLDKKSRAAFTGKMQVHAGVLRIQAHQANHNLLLTREAEVTTKPELEIYAEDVKCTHGATVGQLDDDALFYLTARGIPHDQARKLLTRAFLDEIIDKIENSFVKQYMQTRVNHEVL